MARTGPHGGRGPLIALVAAVVAVGLVLAGCSAASGDGAARSASTGGDGAGGDGAGSGIAAPAAARLSTTTAPAAPNAPSPARVITVTGTGTVSGTPDILTVQLGVQTRASTAQAALTENNTKAAAVIATLEKHGVAKKDLQTSQLSIDPTYSGGGDTITGYQVSNMVTATLHDIGKAGTLVDAAQQAAGDSIRLSQVGFSFADDSALRAKARADAVKQALAQAGQLAAAAGLSLGAVQSITENASGSSPQPMNAAAPSAAGASMPVEPGAQDLTVAVQVVVAIG